MCVYYVKNENTLGYVMAGQPHMFGVLASKPQLGGDNWVNGPTVIRAADKLRLATEADFAHYRVCVPSDFKITVHNVVTSLLCQLNLADRHDWNFATVDERGTVTFWKGDVFGVAPDLAYPSADLVWKPRTGSGVRMAACVMNRPIPMDAMTYVYVRSNEPAFPATQRSVAAVTGGDM